jgi:hypothetical protein
LNLYEVIRWGNNSDDPYTGGPNGPDTCLLVRANSVEEAATLADSVLAELPHERVQPWSHAIYLLGVDGGTDPEPRVLRGPYIEHALGHGWRLWHRNSPEEPWAELEPQPRRRGSRTKGSAGRKGEI